MTPTRTERTTNRASPLSRPPRPPNAWILYRSDMLKVLSATYKGKQQAAISKMVSDLWRNESDETKAKYERMSEIKKAEHALKYPDYRFQPMKREEKERLRAEKQAEKEKERQARKAKGRPRTGSKAAPPPLFTTEARLQIGAPPAGVSGASTSTVINLAQQPQPSQGAESSSELDSQATTFVSVIVDQTKNSFASSSNAPAQHVVEPVTDSDLSFNGEWAQTDMHEDDEQFDFDQFWSHSSLPPNGAGPSNVQEILNIPLPSIAVAPPPDGTEDDLGSFPELSAFFKDISETSPLHAILSATNDPNVFNLDNLDMDVNELFDGKKQIEVSMSGGAAQRLPDFNQLSALSSLFAGFDIDNSFSPNVTNGVMDQSMLLGPGSSYETFTSQGSTDADLRGFSLDSFIQGEATSLGSEEEVDQGGAATGTPNGHAQIEASQGFDELVSYAPPAGAVNSSTRRVAADWRHIRAFSPDFQALQAPAASSSF